MTGADLAPQLVTAAELQRSSFEPPIAYIDGLVLEGLGIIGGRPKLGKSWWCLRAAVTIATNGVAFGNPARRVTPARVLYLALEDGPARLQRRLEALIPAADQLPWPETLTFATTWPRLDAGGLDTLAHTVDAKGIGVVFIDTLGRVRAPRRGKDGYAEDTAALEGLHNLTRDNPGLSVVLVHHARKDDRPDDYVDALSGTTGITGVVDHIALLTRGRGEADAVVKFTSRDADEHETAFRLDGGGWAELGDARRYEQSQARQAVLESVLTLGSAKLTEIAADVGRDVSLTRRMLLALADDGLVEQTNPRGPWKPRLNDPEVQTEDTQEVGLLDRLDRFQDREGVS